MSGTTRTSRVLQMMMNSIASNLEFTIETHEDFENARLPTLDTEIWVEETGKIMYNFYKKPVSAMEVMRQTTALSEST